MEKDTLKNDALNLLEKLAMAHGAPGAEHEVREIFREHFQGRVYADRSGNIFHRIEGKEPGPKVMLAAHMDEVAFAVQSITRSGLIKFIPLGGWWPHTLPAQRVRVKNRAGREIPGVIGARPVHFLKEAERDKVMKIEDMFIDVGASSASEVEEELGIHLGDSVVPGSPFIPMANPDVLMCKAFDDRVGVALLIQALSLIEGEALPCEVIGVGTVQEEVGVRGAVTAAHSADPHVAVVLEGAPADDLPGNPEDECQGKLGKGVQIRLMDPSTIMSRTFVEKAVAVAEEHGIPYQKAVRRSGATDARAIHVHGQGVPTIVLGVPARYIHSHNSIIHLDDYMAALRLLVELIRKLDAQTVKTFTDFGVEPVDGGLH